MTEISFTNKYNTDYKQWLITSRWSP